MATVPRRMQIYLSERQYQTLLSRSKRTKLSIAEQIRQAIDEYLLGAEVKEEYSEDPIWKIEGCWSHA